MFSQPKNLVSRVQQLLNTEPPQALTPHRHPTILALTFHHSVFVAGPTILIESGGKTRIDL